MTNCTSAATTTEPAAPPSVLVIADDRAVAAPVAPVARAAGYCTTFLRSSRDVRAVIQRTRPDVALLHHQHPVAGSLAFRRLAERLGVRVLLFGFEFADMLPAHRADDAAHGDALNDRSHFPVVQLNADGATLIDSLTTALGVA